MPALVRERVAAYRDARVDARRASTVDLRRMESQARRAATDGGLDDVELARLTAVRDELQERGVRLPPLGVGEP